MAIRCPRKSAKKFNAAISNPIISNILSPFIRFIKDRKGIHQYPDPKMVIGSNYCDIGFDIDKFSGRLVILAATDNLIKGAAGSAVQCMNVMMKYPETRGIDSVPLHPV